MAHVDVKFSENPDEAFVGGTRFAASDSEIVRDQKIITEGLAHNFRPRADVIAAGRANDPDKIRCVTSSRVIEAVDAFGSFGMTLRTTPPESITRAVARQLTEGTPTVARTIDHPLLAAATVALRKYLGRPKDRFLFGLSGAFVADAACAIVFRRWAHQRDLSLSGADPAWNDAYLIVMEGNLHGSTLMGRSLSSSDRVRMNLGPAIQNVRRIAFGDIAVLEEALRPHGSRSPAAVLMEPVLGSAGCIAPPDGYHVRVQELCRQYDVPLIFDEIKTGCARTGSDWAFEKYGVEPDIVLGGKAIGGGIYPVSFLSARPELLEWVEPGMFSLTWSATPGACMAILATIQVLSSQKVAAAAERKGARLRERLLGLKERYDSVTEVNGVGLMLAFGTRFPNRTFAEELLVDGVYTDAIARTNDLVYVTPPVLAREESLDAIAEGIERTLIRLG